MCESLTAKQFMELVAFKKMSPPRERRADMRTAQVAKAVFDANQLVIDVLCALKGMPTHKRPKVQQIDLEKFVLKWGLKEKDERKQKQTWREQQQILALWAAAYSQVKAEGK